MRVAEHSLVEVSVVPGDVVVGCGVPRWRVIVDEGCVIPAGFKAGVHPDGDSAQVRATARGVARTAPEMPGQQVHRVRA